MCLTYRSEPGQLVGLLYGGFDGRIPVQRPEAWPSLPIVGLQTAWVKVRLLQIGTDDRGILTFSNNVRD